VTDLMAAAEPRYQPQPSLVPRGGVDDGDVSALGLVNVLLRYRRFIAAVALGLCAISLGWGLVSPRQWSSAAAFVPQGRGTGAAGGLSGLAAQFGVTVPTLEPTQSAAFYQDLLRTNAILGTIVDSGLTGPGAAPRTRSVADLYRVNKEDDPALRRALAIEELDDHLEVGASPKTGLVRVVVRAPDPVAAQRLAERALAEVTRFNVETRQSQAAAERRFVERRLADARADLRAAEARLRDFLEANRIFSAAGLSFERDRLARDVSLRQEVYSSLAQNYERSRIDEVRDTPVITVVEAPARPVRPDSRGLVRLSLLSLVGGALFGSILAFALDFVRSQGGASTAERAEFGMLTRHAAG